MERLTQVISEWEIQLLVLLSFTLQILLFLTGSLRRYSTSMFVRVPIWLAYLGADLVAVSALGFLSRHGQEASGGFHPLAFFWAPFLLIHLGGQDTITAFAIEDNNLWIRHLLTLVVQVTLALYVFWTSIGRYNVHLLVPGIFLFVSGIIKYWERILALMYGSLKNMSCPRVTKEELRGLFRDDDDDAYPRVIGSALCSAPAVRELFAGRTIREMESSLPNTDCRWSQHHLIFRLLEAELGMMYDDLYTKAVVLRNKNGIILRCVSQISAAIALVLFLILSSKQRYTTADMAITYVLFIGGFLLDICAAFTLMKSPWTWMWLKRSPKFHNLADKSWFLFSSRIGWKETRPLWSNRMGQYNLLSLRQSDDQTRRTCKQWMWFMIAKVINLVGIKLFWINRSLNTNYTQVDKKVMESVSHGVDHLAKEIFWEDDEGSERSSPSPARQTLQWPRLGNLWSRLQQEIKFGFAHAVIHLHISTEVHLRSYPRIPTMPEDLSDMIHVCRKLSNYMMYLLATHPELLPVTGRVEDILQPAKTEIEDYDLRRCHDTLKEIRDIWILFLAYAAGKSRPKAHAAQLGEGGELITFVWLIMAHYRIGNAGTRRIELGSNDAYINKL